MGNPFLVFRNIKEKERRREKSPDVLFDLISKTNLDPEAMSDMMRGYLKTGEMTVPDMLPEGVQGPLKPDQRRETPTNSLRQPAYIADKDASEKMGRPIFTRAPEGVTDPITQIRELGRFRGQSEGDLLEYDENGVLRIVPGATSRDRVVRKPRPPAPSGPTGNRGPTAAQEKERLAIEAVTSALRQKMMVNPLTKMTEPILDRNDAVGVAVSAGLDIARYPEIAKLIEGYTETPAEEPEQPGLFQRWFGKGKDEQDAPVASPVSAPAAPTASTPAPQPGGIEVERRTKTGKIAIFDAETKQFLRWK